MRAAFTATMLMMMMSGCLPTGGGGGGRCVPGQVGVCGCPGGEQGTAICQDNGSPSACMCGEGVGADGGVGETGDARVGETGDGGPRGWRPPTRGGDAGVVDPPPPEDCEAGAFERAPCEAGGERERHCADGVWAAWGPCIDPDATCADGDTEQLACGRNGRGLQERACADGRWAAPGACIDEDACVDGARDPIECPDGSVVARTCVTGQWGAAPECPEGPDPDCASGDVETRACGAGGAQQRRCSGAGQWGAWGECAGEPVCVQGDEQTRPCDGDGTQSRGCAGGQWDAWGACERVVLGCGEATPLNLGGDTPFDTRGHGDALPDACGADSPEQIFSFRLERASRVRVEVVQATFDTIIGVREDCEDDLSCDDDGGNDTLSKLDVELQPGTYHVVVEGYGGAQGSGLLTATVFPSDDEPDPPPGEAASWSGVRTDVPVAELVAGGFEPCWSDTYADIVSPAAVRTQCGADVLVLGCRQVGRAALTVAAMGVRAEVLRPVADTADATHLHNDVEWYFTEGRAWGFAPGGQAVNRNHCDTTEGDDRICWHLDAGGFRCGGTQWLNANGTWERVIYQRVGAL